MTQCALYMDQKNIVVTFRRNILSLLRNNLKDKRGVNDRSYSTSILEQLNDLI